MGKPFNLSRQTFKKKVPSITKNKYVFKRILHKKKIEKKKQKSQM